jgi:predicted  nucleic acid-binding Zn-ribbon protein
MENKFVTQEEMDEIKSVQKDYEKVSKDLGGIELHKIALEEQKQGLINFINQIREKEMDLGKRLNEKYGEVSINPLTGEIIPADVKK